MEEETSFEKSSELDYSFCDENHKDDRISCEMGPLVKPLPHLLVKAAQTSCAASASKPIASELINAAALQNNDVMQQESSILVSVLSFDSSFFMSKHPHDLFQDCLVFPETNDEVKRYLNFIRKAVAVHHLQLGVLPEVRQ